MGCCQSSPTDDAPSPAVRPAASIDTSVRALQAAPEPLSRSLSSVDSRRLSHEPPAPTLAGLNLPNKPIRPASPLRSSPAHLPHQPPPWTKQQLETERAAFFDTRVAGRPEVWNALRLVCEMLRQGNNTEAQGIMDAVSVTCPNGRVAAGKGKDRVRGGVYDEFGALYEIPSWIVADPRDTIEDEEKPSDSVGESFEDDRSDVDKGKGRAADLGEVIQLCARLSDRGTDITVSVGKKEKVAAIVRKIQDQAGAKRMRLVYLGHVLQETKTLDAQNYRPGDVVNAYVFDGPEDLLRKQRTK